MSRRSSRLGVVGAGYWGKNLIRNCAELGVLAAVCDADPAVLVAVAGRYPGIVTTTHLEQLLACGIDAVIVAGPAPLHAQMARQALTAGKHVFVEKPFALAIADAESIVQDAERAGLVSFAGHLVLYHPAMRRLLELMREGAIGEPVHARSRRLSLGKLREHESVWWSFAPHDVALMLEIYGQPPSEVTAMQHRASRHPLADFAYADLRFPGGGSAHIEVSWRDPDKCSRLDLFGREGVLTFIDARQGPSVTLTRCGEVDGATGRLTWSERPVAVRFPPGEPLRLELEAFLDAIERGVRAPTEGRHALEVVRVLVAADRRPPFPLEAFVRS